MTVGDGGTVAQRMLFCPSSISEPFGGEDERTWLRVAPPEEGRE